MAGLLFKDFVGIKGKRIVYLLLGFTILFVIIRFLFPGDDSTVVYGAVMENEARTVTVGDVHDSILSLFPLVLATMGLYLCVMWTMAVCKNDEKIKTRQFVKTLPLKRNTYIASKYLFTAISVYILFSLEMIWIVIFNSNAGQNDSVKLMSALSSFLTVINGLGLVIASFELPCFIIFGVKKATMIMTGVLEGLFLLAVAYILFGDMKVFEKIDFAAIANWYLEHVTFTTMFSVFSPVFCLFVFWLSFAITCHINQNGEVQSNG